RISTRWARERTALRARKARASARGGADVRVFVQGQSSRCARNRTEAEREHRTRRQRAKVRQSPADHSATNQLRRRISLVVGTLRPRDRDAGHLRGTGRDRAGRGGSIEAKAAGQGKISSV